MIAGSGCAFAQAGTPDPSFGINGIVTTSIGSSFDDSFAVRVQDDGKIVVAGRATILGFSEVAIARYLPDGTLDPEFSDDGKKTISVGSGSDVAYAMAIQDDGKIIVAGYSDNGGGLDFLVIRMEEDGTLDDTFGGNGIVTLNPDAGDDVLRMITILPDNRILLTGYVGTGADERFGLACLNTDGNVDENFGNGGLVITEVGPSNARAFGAVLLPGNDFYVAGYAYNGDDNDMVVVKYQANGSVDTSFGTNGVAWVDAGSGNDQGRSVLITDENKILIAGYGVVSGNGDFVLARLLDTGALDNSFGVNGVVTTDIQTFHDDVSEAVMQDDGKIVVTGRSGVNFASSSEFAVVRYNSDGSLDTSFGGDGKVTTSIGTNEDDANALTLQSDGKIIVAGGTDNGPDNDFAVVRYNGDDGTPVKETAAASTLQIFPNPSNEHIQVICPDHNGDLIITDTLGKVTVRRAVRAQTESFDISEFPPGWYIVTWKSESRTAKVRFIAL